MPTNKIIKKIILSAIAALVVVLGFSSYFAACFIMGLDPKETFVNFSISTYESAKNAALIAYDSVNDAIDALNDKVEKIRLSIANLNEPVLEKADEQYVAEPYKSSVLSYDKDGDVILTGGTSNIVYYSQNDPRWSAEYYGETDSIGKYGCGPTTLSIIVSSLTDEKIIPPDMAKWAYDNGQFSQGSGSYHSIIPKGAEAFGLKSESITDYSKENIIKTLYTGKIIVVLMDKGTLTDSGHFVVLRGVSLDGKVMIADPRNIENSEKFWELDLILNEAKYGAQNGGPFWAISK